MFYRIINRQGHAHVLNFTSGICFMFMVWKGLGLITNTKSPILVVLSGSMEPAFQRGDLLFLVNSPNQQYRTGDVVVYGIPGRKTPIVHRVLEGHNIQPRESLRYHAADQVLLTKGDNNGQHDQALYEGLDWLQRKHVMGKVRGFVPYVGYASIVMNDLLYLKEAMFVILGLVAIVRRK